jgi:hypothetical protein
MHWVAVPVCAMNQFGKGTIVKCQSPKLDSTQGARVSNQSGLMRIKSHYFLMAVDDIIAAFQVGCYDGGSHCLVQASVKGRLIYIYRH